MKKLWLLLVLAPSQLGLGATGPSAPERYVAQYASQYRVPPELIAALIDVESSWNPHVVSKKGAMGMMQLMPATARRFGAFQPFDEEQNIAAVHGMSRPSCGSFAVICDSSRPPITPEITGLERNNSIIRTQMSSPTFRLSGGVT